MFKIFGTVATAAFLLGAPSLYAQDQGSFYVGGGAGFVFAGNTRGNGVFTSTGSSLDGLLLGELPSSTAKGRFDPTFSGNVTLGYDFGMRRFGRLRLEGEIFSNNAETDSYKGLLDGNAINPPAKVDSTIRGAAINAAYDIGKFKRMQPYAILGFGQAKVSTKYDFGNIGQTEIGESNMVIQAGFGLDFYTNDRTTYDLKYRFRRVGTNEKGIDGDFDSQIIELGIRYKF